MLTWYAGLVIHWILTSQSRACHMGFPDRIVSGDPAHIERFPYQVSLEKKYQPSCGGSIIHPAIILTAAHCLVHVRGLQSIRPYDLLVRAGSNTAQFGGSEHFVQAVEVRKTYQYKPDSSDVGLVLLKNPVPITTHSRPIPLSSVTPNSGDTAWITGYGSREIQELRPVEDPAQGDVHQLMAVRIPIFEKKHCSSVMSDLGTYVADDMICAGSTEGHRDACKGDSGGPMVVRGVQVGITAWGVGCGRRGIPGIYTDVAHHVSWIVKCSSRLLAGKSCET